MSATHAIRLALRRLGLDLQRYRADEHPLARRARLLEARSVATVLDVGANSGQFGRELRELGYRGRIVSFEPLSAAFAALERAARGSPPWEVHRCALGEQPGRASIHVAANSYSSSLLAMLPAHLQAAPDSRYVGREDIEVRTLDAVLPGLGVSAGAVYLKVDTQGFEERVLAGAARSLERIALVQLEMSLVPLYEGAASFERLLGAMTARGYRLIGVDPGFTDAVSARVLQVDATFERL